VTIPDSEKDPCLQQKLRDELPGILNWAVKGCLEWQRVGLRPPPVVTGATARYREDEDVLGEFVKTHCTTGESCEIEKSDLYNIYQGWAKAAGVKLPITARKFGKRIKARKGIRDRESNSRCYWVGIAERMKGWDADLDFQFESIEARRAAKQALEAAERVERAHRRKIASEEAARAPANR
jgi:putative DNA primase/helicase